MDLLIGGALATLACGMFVYNTYKQEKRLQEMEQQIVDNQHRKHRCTKSHRCKIKR
jgi:hypothetical protein